MLDHSGGNDMSQKISRYVSTSRVEAIDALHSGSRHFLKFFGFSMSTLIGKLLVVGFPLFALAEFHIVSQIQKTKHFDLESAFEDSQSGKKFWTTALCALLGQIIVIAGGLLIFLLYLGLKAVGSQMDYSFRFNRFFTVFFFGLFCILLFALLVVWVSLYFDPVVFLIQSNGDMGISEALRQARAVMTPVGRGKLFWMRIYYLIAITVVAGLGYGAFYLWYAVLPTFWGVGLLAVLFCLLLLLTMSRILLSERIACVKLFSDLVEEAAFQNFFVSKPEESLQGKIRKEQILATLFEETITEIVEKPQGMKEEGVI